MARTPVNDDYEDQYSVRKPNRNNFRRGARDAALAMADFWGAVADTAADVLTATADGVATSCGTIADGVASDGRRFKHSRSQAEAFAAASRYFDEMARISREAETVERQTGTEPIDYERLAKAVAAEINRSKSNPAE